MKRIVLLFISLISVLHVSAQNLDSLNFHNSTISTDSLCLRLNKLQHDYDYLYCDYEIHKMVMELRDLSNSTKISSNGVLINYYNSRFNHDLYLSYLKDYNSNRALYNALKEKIETLREWVTLKVITSDFTESEIDIIKAGLDLIKKAAATVEGSLDYYDVTIQAYRSIR